MYVYPPILNSSSASLISKLILRKKIPLSPKKSFLPNPPTLY